MSGCRGYASKATPRPTSWSLRRLQLSYNRIGDAGACALALPDGLPALEALVLGSNPIGPRGAYYLSHGEHLGDDERERFAEDAAMY